MLTKAESKADERLSDSFCRHAAQHRTMKRFRLPAHYALSKAIPNSNAPVLTNGGTVVQVPVLGVIGRETRGGALQGELCSPRVARQVERLGVRLASP